MKVEVIPIKTDYIKPNEGYYTLITNIIKYCQDDDYIVISETPISTAEGNLVDESKYIPSITASILTELWSKYLWGYVLCPFLGYKKRTITNLRNMPHEARYHKQFILEKYGLKYALQPTSEAGVDLSNVPEQYVSLLPENPQKSADYIKEIIHKKTGKNVNIIICDTDSTYDFYGKKFTTLPKSIETIHNNTGIFGYILGNFSKKIGPTPLASTVKCDVEMLIKLCAIAEKSQVENTNTFFETVYNMKTTFDTDYNKVTPALLNTITHIPAVIIRF